MNNFLYAFAAALMGGVGGLVVSRSAPSAVIWGAAIALTLFGSGGMLGRVPVLWRLRNAAPSAMHVRELWTLATFGLSMVAGLMMALLLAIHAR